MNSRLAGARPSGSRYALAIFLSSSVLFALEPIAAKRLLPLLGGSAAVWTTCLVFFQCALLLGYLLAHALVTRATARQQLGSYVVLLLASVAQLAVASRLDLHADSAHPVRSALWFLTAVIGLPFVTLAATGPLLQAWYARAVHHAEVHDSASTGAPTAYRLFAVSNIGSLLSLLAYPWIIEPRLSTHAQVTALTALFALLGLLCASIAYSVRAIPVIHAGDAHAVEPDAEFAPATTWGDRVSWIALSACGSLLLSAVTNHVSQNIATIPLLWIVPLVLYLLTFVIAFAGGGDRWRSPQITGVAGLLGFGLLATGVFGTAELEAPVTQVLAGYGLGLFLVCLFCHGELYRRRPAPAQLTMFYLAVALGGALGAILVGLVAPVVLSGSYELAIGLLLTAVAGLAVTASIWLRFAGS